MNQHISPHECYCHALASWEGECEFCAAFNAYPPYNVRKLRELGTRSEWTLDAIAFACFLAFLIALPFTLACARAVIALASEGKLF